MELPIEARFADLNYQIKRTEEESEEALVKKIEDKKFVKLEGWHKIRLEIISKKQNQDYQILWAAGPKQYDQIKNELKEKYSILQLNYLQKRDMIMQVQKK